MSRKIRRVIIQSEIERAINNTLSNRSAAMYLGVSYPTYKKYAKRYYDTDGNNLFIKHRNQAGRNISKGMVREDGSIIRLEDILQNKYKSVNLQSLKIRLIHFGYLEEKCALCGFEERRITDMQTPLLLIQKDGNKENFKLGNLELLCYNCYFLTVGNIVGRKEYVRYTEYAKAEALRQLK